MHIFSKKSVSDRQAEKVDETRRDILKTAALGGVGTAALGAGMLADINFSKGVKAADGDPIPVGQGAGYTGWGAADGNEFRNGLNMAIEEINAMGGILGRPLEPHFEDTTDQGPDQVIPAFQRMIDSKGVHAIINGYNASVATAEYDTIADSGIIYLHNNTDQSQNDVVSSDPEKYFSCFQNDPVETWYGPGVVRFVNGLESQKVWTRPNNRVAIITIAQRYSVRIAEGARDTLPEAGFENALFETVAFPTTDWGPVLAKVREVDPAVIICTHWLPQDQAQFMLQFTPNPTNSIVYFQYGASLNAFRDIGGPSVNGTIYSTVIGALQDKTGMAFQDKYRAKFGEKSTPMVGSQTYDGCYLFAIAASLAGGSGEPGDFDQNVKVADRLRSLIYRGVGGTTRFYPEYQSAVPYPTDQEVSENDPSLGMPHLFLQIPDHKKPPILIAPDPYTKAKFQTPPWFK
jgi:branched-chain amino acid transport system substrate-binding protein